MPPTAAGLYLRQVTAASATGKVRSGFSLLELLVVLAIVAMATAGVTLVLRDGADSALEREAQRLVALFESARAQSRASGVVVHWQTAPGGFLFEGLPTDALPTRWLAEGMTVLDNPTVLLGPEPIVGAQAIEVVNSQRPQRTIRIATNGLRPFAVQPTARP